MSDSPAADRLLRRLDRRVPAALLLAAGILVLASCRLLEAWLASRARAAAVDAAEVAAAREDLDAEIAERMALRELSERGLTRAKAEAASATRSQRALFEGGMALSEEKRLLEKQLEIMTTWLLLDAAGDRIQVMHGEQAAESWPLSGARPRTVGPAGKALPRLLTIVSKERYAHPERGKSVQAGGRLDWEPPQVGTSARARALGEDVMFTREGLILHGPPLDKAEHESFPHRCLSLPAETARRLYARSFIGTRVMLKAP